VVETDPGIPVRLGGRYWTACAFQWRKPHFIVLGERRVSEIEESHGDLYGATVIATPRPPKINQKVDFRFHPPRDDSLFADQIISSCPAVWDEFPNRMRSR
jgi:hypothetical protein